MSNELRIGRKEDPLDRVEKRSATVELLASAGSLEITRHEISAGRHIWLYASDEWAGFEFFYILSGTITLESGEGDAVQLGPGDYLYHHGLQEKEYFRVETDIEILLVANAPSFHLMRDELEGMVTLALSVEEKDPLTEGHCSRLDRLAIATGERLGLASQQLIDLSYAAYLHDIGKVKVPDEILNKNGPLTDIEQEEMRRHTLYGGEMLADQEFLANAAKIVVAHHENYDGSGYPEAVSRGDIPIEARIIRVVDTYDAITTTRPYQKALAREEAIRELEENAGTQFDPRVVKAFLEVVGSTEEGNQESHAA